MFTNNAKGDLTKSFKLTATQIFSTVNSQIHEF